MPLHVLSTCLPINIQRGRTAPVSWCYEYTDRGHKCKYFKWNNKRSYATIIKLFISVINELDAQNFCFTISLFNASTCFEHMCSKHVEALNKLTVKEKFCASSSLITEINNLIIE